MNIVIETPRSIESHRPFNGYGFSNSKGVCGHTWYVRGGIVVTINGTPEQCESLANELLRAARAARDEKVTL